MDGYDIIIHRRNNWVSPGKDGVALNMDREDKAVKWEKMEEILRNARDRFMDSDVPLYTVMAEAIETINESRTQLIEQEMAYIPMRDEIEEDLKRRKRDDDRMIEQMNL